MCQDGAITQQHDFGAPLHAEAWLRAGGCSTASQVSPYFIADTTGVCTPQGNAPLPNLPTAGTAYECPTWKLNRWVDSLHN